MARKFVSPGVFTQELDQSYIASGVGAIGAVVIGRTAKGPGLKPTVVTDFNDFVAQFGDVDPTMQAPYAVKNYLKNSSVATVVRVLGDRSGAPDPTKVTNGATYTPVAIVATGSDVLAIVNVLSGTVFTLSGSSSYPVFSFSGTSGPFSSGTYAGTLTFLATDPSYIGNVLNTDPTKASLFGHWLYKNFVWAGSGTGPGFTTASLSATAGYNLTASFDTDFTAAVTPWITAQPYGSQSFQLFRFHTLGGGAESNVDIKVSIASIKASVNSAVTKYGTFDVIVRAFTDTDGRLVQDESFSNVTLDPLASNYLPRVIGDQYRDWNSTTQKLVTYGTFKNSSKFIRVEMAAGATPPADALPWGHSGYPEVMAATFGTGSIHDVPYVLSNLDTQSNLASYTYWGLNFSAAGVVDRLKFSGDPLHVITSAVTGFSLTHLSGATTAGGVAYTAYNTGTNVTIPTTASQQGFTVAFYGGFDGFDQTQVDPLSPTGATAISTVSIKKALDLIANPDEIDVNLVVIPGITSQPVTSYAEQICNARADAMYVMDISGSSVSQVISAINTAGIDDNYAATYYPWLRYADTTNNVLVTVAPSVAVLGAIAYNDRVGQVFFAPAGLNRGGLSQFGIVDTLDRLTFQDRNDLYENRINPIATFPNEGIVIWGQKTLQVKASALDRVNVRRLLIYAKKTIASVARYLLFEPNNPQTWQRFLSQVNPILDKVRMDQGLERFKVVMDSTVNTPDLIDRNIMTGKIFLQPTRASEYIDLSFIITSSGVQFEE